MSHYLGKDFLLACEELFLSDELSLCGALRHLKRMTLRRPVGWILWHPERRIGRCGTSHVAPQDHSSVGLYGFIGRLEDRGRKQCFLFSNCSGIMVFMSFSQTTPMFLQKGMRSFVYRVNGLTPTLKLRLASRTYNVRETRAWAQWKSI